MKGFEREVAEASDGGSSEAKSESLMRLSWALVHSKQPEDVHRGIVMLEVVRLKGTVSKIMQDCKDCSLP